MSEMLYHVKRTIVDLKNDVTGALQKVDIRGTYTDLAKAKEAAKREIVDEGYEKDDFPVYDVKGDPDEWKHGDGIFVYAEAPEGEKFWVRIETTPNELNLKGTNGKVEEKLFHVIQTTIHYNKDRSGAIRDTSIEGTFTNFDDAKKKALTCLLDEDVSKSDFAEYDEFTGQQDWAFGEDTIVHAVGVAGENYVVAIIRK
ncbi:hypothetical protein BCR34DRAFT_94779 [Clohesyomyces aquaticus]|uniref:Uncharacterized protein n=1 Tax=Clohesyomyces aquaticus TaxID=1231657 RepID=A0A1Y2A1Y8_9PLEO|nr:hypothetical protein BCR34DRAFT_94779 [Clohesyomyces aquaticus]